MLVREVRRWWQRLGEISRSEHDERDQLLRLLAIRDAFAVVMALFLILTLVNSLLKVEQRREVAPVVLVVLPLVALLLAGLTAIFSWKTRGGGLSLPATLLQTVVVGAGLLLGNLVFVLLLATGVLDLTIRLFPYLVGVLLGFALLTTFLMTTAPRHR